MRENFRVTRFKSDAGNSRLSMHSVANEKVEVMIRDIIQGLKTKLESLLEN